MQAGPQKDEEEGDDYWNAKTERRNIFDDNSEKSNVTPRKKQEDPSLNNKLKKYGLGDDPETVDWHGNPVSSKSSAIPKRPSNPPKLSARGTVNASSQPSTSVVGTDSVRFSKPSSVSEADRVSVSSSSSQQTNTSNLSHRRSASDASGKVRYTETPSPTVSADSVSSIDEAVKRDGKLSATEASHLMAENKSLERKILSLNKSRWSPMPIADTVSRIISGEKYSLEPYKSLKDKVALLDAVVGYHDGNAILAVVIFLKRTLSRSIFYEEMKKRPEAVNQYIAFLKHQQTEDVAKEMEKLGKFDDVAMWRLKKACEDNSPDARHNAVSKCNGWFQMMDSPVYEASMVQEFVLLLSKQLQIEPEDARAQREGRPPFSQLPRKTSLYFHPLITTLFYLCLYHYNEPETSFSSPLALKNEFKITEKQYLYTALRARCKVKDWNSIEALFTAKNWRGKAKFKAPMKFEKVVEVLAGINVPVQILEKYVKLVEDADSRLQLAKQHNCHGVVIDTLVEMKDRVRLEAYGATVRGTSDENHFQIVMRNSSIKWKN